VIVGLYQFAKHVGVALGARRLLHALAARGRRKPPLLRMYRKLPAGELLPAPSLPGPYRLGCYRPGDESRWVELLNDSGEFGRWDAQRLAGELLSTLLHDGGIFLLHDGRLVGCASACAMSKFAPEATLMYVALLPEHRGKGLGQALVLETLRVCQRERCPGMHLQTENHRLAAVRSYFKLGFTPLAVAEGDAGRRQWAEVLERAFLQGVKG
jgi:GNAT superfamily N-acetyltransferase